MSPTLVVLSLLLIGTLVIIPGSTTALQAGDYTYTVNNGEATITGYTGAGGAITIPSTLGGYSVAAIGDGAFYLCTSVTSANIPSSVTTLGNGAFEYSGLISVTIPGSVETIGPNVFAECYSLTSVTMLDGVTTIADTEFVNCYSLASVTIPSSITSIGFAAFSKCHSLTSIDIPSSVTSIGEQAFIQCFSLTSVTIPGGVTSIAAWTFGQCTALTSVVVPDSVDSVEGYAFDHCTDLTNVTVGSSVSSIGESAFSGCANLTSIVFLGLVAPTIVGPAWISNTDPGIRGHAYVASNFPAPGGVFNGLTMGAPILAAPGVPTDLTADSGNAQVELMWHAPASDGGSPVTGYRVYRALTSTGAYGLIASPSTLLYLDTNLTNGQTYWYKVSAVNAIGEGARAGPVSSVPATFPSAPRNLTATGSTNKVTLSWEEPSSSGGITIIRYEIHRGSTQDAIVALIANVSTGILIYEDTGVTANTTYYYLVKAANNIGSGPASNVASGTTPPATVPGAPLNVTVTTSAGVVEISWQAPSSDGGSAITGYQVYRELGGTSELLANVSASVFSYTDTTGAAGTTYQYYVVSTNSVGPGANSTQVSASSAVDNTMLYIGIGALLVVVAGAIVVLLMRRRK